MKCRILTCLLILMVISFGELNAQSQTAQKVLEKTKSLINANKGLSADFTISGNGTSQNGSLKAKSSKFSVLLPGSEVWYNGSLLYTYNKKTRETTLTKPTYEELSEINPLEYINNGVNNYNVGFSNEKQSGKYILAFTPKGRQSDVKKLVLYIKSNNYYPEKMIVYPRSGSPVNIILTSLKPGQNLSDSDFEYPAHKYKGIEVIDLR